MESIEILYPEVATNLDVYDALLGMAHASKNDLLIVSYAQKILALQTKYQSDAYTPETQFMCIEALKRLGKEKEALTLAQTLLPDQLSNKNKIKLFYQMGELNLKLKDETKAKAYFTQCVDMNETSSWKSICQQNLDLLP